MPRSCSYHAYSSCHDFDYTLYITSRRILFYLDLLVYSAPFVLFGLVLTLDFTSYRSNSRGPSLLGLIPLRSVQDFDLYATHTYRLQGGNRPSKLALPKLFSLLQTSYPLQILYMLYLTAVLDWLLVTLADFAKALESYALVKSLCILSGIDVFAAFKTHCFYSSTSTSV